MRQKPASSTLQFNRIIQVHFAILQVADLPSTIAPIFFQLIHAAQPQGTELEVHEHLEEHETIRYVPDLELKELKTQLTNLGGPIVKRK